MRVALYHHLPPGGALRVVRDFVRGTPDDVHVDVFGLDDVNGSHFPRAGDLIEGPRPHLEPLDAGWSARVLGGKLARSIQATRLDAAEHAIARSINQGGYDVAYVHPCWMTNAPGLVGLLELPTVLYLQEVRRTTFEPSYRERSPRTIGSIPGRLVFRETERILERRDRSGVENATVLACNSAYSAERILASYGRSAQVVALGVDERVFRPKAVGLPGSSPTVMAVGGLEPFKNQLVIVEALGLVEASHRPRLVLVYERCDPAYRETVLLRAAELRVEVDEHRGINDEQLAELYSTATATVLAAQLEPFGLTALESIACGTPVVGVKEAGYRETITDGLNGLLVPRSVGALAEAIDEVVSTGAGLMNAHDLRSTILPWWSVAASIERQLELLAWTSRA